MTKLIKNTRTFRKADHQLSKMYFPFLPSAAGCIHNITWEIGLIVIKACLLLDSANLCPLANAAWSKLH